MLSVVSILVVVGSVFPTAASAFWPFSNHNAVGGGKPENVQTMPLPAPSMSGKVYDGIGGGGIEIVDGSAILPLEGPAGTPLEIAESAKSEQISRYIVRSGDNLSSIAELFNVSVNTIMWANDISNAKTIQPGQELVILPVTGIQYTVKNGGTLRDIVKKYGGDLDETARYNGIDPDEYLPKGAVVIVPDGEIVAPKSSPAYSVGTRTARGTSGPSYMGYYAHPVPSGARRTQGLHGYNGVDLAAPVGTPIVASATGDVIVARGSGWNGGYGIYVVITHANGTQTLYAHLSRTAVQTGEHVIQGQIIGFVGATGRSTGAHLHFEVRGAKNPY